MNNPNINLPQIGIRVSSHLFLQSNDPLGIIMKIEIKELMVSISARLGTLTSDVKWAYSLMEKIERARNPMSSPAIVDEQSKLIKVDERFVG